MDEQSGKILIAIIAAAVSLIVAIYNSITSRKVNKEIEVLKNKLSQESSEKNARRDYEYEARKKLYQEYESLLFQLNELASIAYSRIEGIAKSFQDGSLNRDDWTEVTNEYFKNTIYKLIAPLAIYKLMQKKLTYVDFGVEPKIHAQYTLLKILYSSFHEEFKIAREGTTQEDKDYLDTWKREYIKPSDKFRRQGIPSGQLDKVTEFFTSRDKEKNNIIISYGQYENMFYDTSDEYFYEIVNLAGKPFIEFHPDDKPILWTLLIIHASIYFILSKVKFISDYNKRKIIDLANEFYDSKADDFSWSKEREEYHSYWSKAREFTLKSINKKIEE